VPESLTYGCTEEQFSHAVVIAQADGLMHVFQPPRGSNLCYQPTREGFARAEQLFPKLPADFCTRVLKRSYVLQEESVAFREKFSKKK
jgi:hypothetical protein